MRIELSVGAFAPVLADQLRGQGLSLNDHDLEHFEKDRAALGRLGVRGVLTSGEQDRAAQRLLKVIAKKVVRASGSLSP